MLSSLESNDCRTSAGSAVVLTRIKPDHVVKTVTKQNCTEKLKDLRNFRSSEGVDWIDLAQDMEKKQALVYMVVKFLAS
jgi:hypothetical protein